MPLPVRATVTCDIYHSGSPLSGTPDVSGVPCVLQAAFAQGSSLNYSSSDWVFTHVLLVDNTVDVRDAYSGSHNFGTTADTVVIPDRQGTCFRVVFVELVGRGTAQNHKRVYLDRKVPTWPTHDL